MSVTTTQVIIYSCTAVAALAVAMATPGPPETIDAAISKDGNAFCVAAVGEARGFAPSINWPSQRMLLSQRPIAEAGLQHRLTCTTESDAPIRITFDVVCPRADSDSCVQVRSIVSDGGALFETPADTPAAPEQ